MTPEQKSIERLRKEADHHRVIPSARVWDRLEDRLDLDKSKRHTSMYRSIAVAASLLLCFTVAGHLLMKSTDNASTTASDVSYSLNEFIEDKDRIEDVYNVDNVRKQYGFYGQQEI